MSQWDIYNKILLLWNEHPGSFTGVHNDYEAAAEHLCIENLLFSIYKESDYQAGSGPVLSNNYRLYAITSQGVKLVASLPKEYEGRPYDYFLKQKDEAAQKEIDFKELINKVNKATIRTSMWTKLMFIATLVIAAGTLALAIYPLIQRSDASKAIQQIQYRLQQIDNRTLPQTQTMPPAPTVISRTRLKDSLKQTSVGK